MMTVCLEKNLIESLIEVFVIFKLCDLRHPVNYEQLLLLSPFILEIKIINSLTRR